MSPQPLFMDEDRMHPVYCRRCKAHVPAAASQKQAGLCDVCFAAQQKQLQAQQQLHAVNTGLGWCPKCGSSNLTQSRKRQSGVLATGCGILVIVAWLFLWWEGLDFFSGSGSGRSRAYHRCLACGHEFKK